MEQNQSVSLKRTILFFVLVGIFLAHIAICMLATYSRWEVLHDLGQSVTFGGMLWRDGIMWFDVLCAAAFSICAGYSLYKYRKGKQAEWDAYCRRMSGTQDKTP